MVHIFSGELHRCNSQISLSATTVKSLNTKTKFSIPEEYHDLAEVFSKLKQQDYFHTDLMIELLIYYLSLHLHMEEYTHCHLWNKALGEIYSGGTKIGIYCALYFPSF